MDHKLDELWKSSGGNYDRGDQHRYPQYTIKNHREYAKLIIQDVINSIESTGYNHVQKHGLRTTILSNLGYKYPYSEFE